jgi:mannosyl-3-phosphoglycerate phosphatase
VRARTDWVFFTDLDGTLLDHVTYRWRAAGRALGLLRRRGHALVIVTSKTRAEVLPVLRGLGRREPFVVENGGAIYFPAAYWPFPLAGAQPGGRGWRRMTLGVPRARLVGALGRAARRAQVQVRGFAQMSVQEVAERTGLGRREARQALRREYDEPFVILDSAVRSAWTRLRREIGAEGLRATRGSRFFHVLGANGKGAAVRLLMGWFRRAAGPRVRAVGLGDSPNDIALLRAVDVAVLVARPSGRYDAETLAAVPRAQRARGIGPAGWDRAVRKLLGERS